jgi:hypothetical protein
MIATMTIIMNAGNRHQDGTLARPVGLARVLWLAEVRNSSRADAQSAASAICLRASACAT